MGYYTDYQLTVTRENMIVEDGELEPIIHKLEEISHYKFDEVERNCIMLWEAKWYDNNEDVAVLSMFFPECRFDLEGNGEEEDDIWEATYINGMVHERDCMGDQWNPIPDFDPTQLKPARIPPSHYKHLAPLLAAIPQTEEIEQLNNIL